MCVHTKKPIMMISRNKYLNQLVKAKNNGFAKVVMEIRRCNKSNLLNTIFLKGIFNFTMMEFGYTFIKTPIQ